MVVKGVLSDQAYVTSGVPQGSVFGLTLFALYTGDVTKDLRLLVLHLSTCTLTTRPSIFK